METAAKELFVTVTGFDHYAGRRVFSIGALVLCRKEPENFYDPEAIVCLFPGFGKLGYLANSVHTVAEGCMSAGRVYDKVEDTFFIRVLFKSYTKIICRVEKGEQAELEREFACQLLQLTDPGKSYSHLCSSEETDDTDREDEDCISF